MTRHKEQAETMLRAIAYLRENPGAHLREVARHAGVPIRAVRSLVERIALCGKQPFGPDDLIDAYVEDDAVYLEFDQQLGAPTRFTREEALALSIALRAIAEDTVAPYAAAAHRALEKMRAIQGKDVDCEVRAIERRIAVEPTSSLDTCSSSACFVLLEQAFEDRREVEIEYHAHSRDAVSTRKLRTYALVQHMGAWYAIGWDGLRHGVRIFRVDRIRSARATDATYTIPASFKAERYRRDVLFVGAKVKTARVRFRPPLARIVRAEWDPEAIEQDGDPLGEGFVVARIEYVHEAGILPALAGFGAAVEVLEPRPLKDALRARCRRTLDLYRRPA